VSARIERDLFALFEDIARRRARSLSVAMREHIDRDRRSESEAA